MYSTTMLPMLIPLSTEKSENDIFIAEGNDLGLLLMHHGYDAMVI